MAQRPQITTEDVAQNIETSIDASSSIKTDDIERPDLAIATDTSLNDPVTGKYVKDLAFMEDIVTFVVGKTKDKNDPDPILAGVNGITKVIQLGVEQKLARKFLNVLINNTLDVTTHEYTDKDGLSQTRIQTNATPALSIQLIDDPAPNRAGWEWFARVQYGKV